MFLSGRGVTQLGKCLIILSLMLVADFDIDLGVEPVEFLSRRLIALLLQLLDLHDVVGVQPLVVGTDVLVVCPCPQDLPAGASTLSIRCILSFSDSDISCCPAINSFVACSMFFGTCAFLF